MMYTVLAKTASDMGGAFSPERLSLSGQMILIGMGMIFAVLGILWAVLALFKVFFARPVKEKAKKKAPAAPAAPAPAAPAAVEPEPVVESQDDETLIAVITAAIVAYEASNGNDVAPSGFRVVSFRRTNGGKAWNSK